MKVLFLGTSDDANDRIPDDSRAISVASRTFTEATGIPVEPEFRIIWPAPELPDLVTSWLERYDPDMVVIHVNPYWFTYRSVPARLKRRFGRLGSVAFSAGLKAAATPILAENALFRTVRGVAVRTIGGDLAIEPRGCIDLMEAIVRRVLAREDTVVLIQGPHRPNDASGTDSGFQTAYEACQRVTDELERICERLHVTYLRRPIARRGDIDGLTGDRVHVNTAEHIAVGREEGEWMVTAWEAAQPAATTGSSEVSVGADL